jgi:hypothetical protein
MFRRHLILAAVFATAMPAVACAAGPQFGARVVVQGRSPSSNIQFAYREGYDRGVRAGNDDGRRREPFRYEDEYEYRNGGAGYRPQYGNRDRYRDEFRRGFAEGYRVGYDRNGRYDRPLPGRGLPPAYGRGGAYGRYDFGSQNGFTDGYSEGQKDGRGGRRFDPIAESRYRSGDHGYKNSYGSKDRYKIAYRDAFRIGYEQGYQDGSRGRR